MDRTVSRATPSRATAVGVLVALLALDAGPVAAAAPRTVLAELFGSTDCADCPPARDALEGLRVDLPVLTLEWHPVGALASADAGTRAALYGDPALPTAVFDGLTHAVGAGGVPAYRPIAEARAAAGSPLLVEASYNLDGTAPAGTLVVQISVAEGETVPDPGDWLVRAVLLENAVPACCGPGGEDTWNRVARRLLTLEPLEASVPGQGQFLRRVFPLDPAWDVENLDVLVFVQHATTGEVLQATDGEDAGGLQPVPVSGLDESRVQLYPGFPNPFVTEIRLLFTLPRPQTASVRVYDATGRIVRSLTEDVRPRGIHNVYWDGTDPRGERAATGIYFVRLRTEDATETTKILLLR